MNLVNILTQYGSDKNTTHQYGIIYELILNYQYLKIKQQLKILEIGVLWGDSALAFSSIPYVEKYVGVDVRDMYSSGVIRGTMSPSNVKIHGNTDAYTSKCIDMLLENHGKFHIAIDDGPHSWESQKYFLEHYDRVLEDNGVLICEDIKEKNIEELIKLREELDIYILDLRMNTNINRDEIICLRFK